MKMKKDEGRIGRLKIGRVGQRAGRKSGGFGNVRERQDEWWGNEKAVNDLVCIDFNYGSVGNAVEKSFLLHTH